MAKYEHPDNAIQQYTDICLHCGRNVNSTDECIAPFVPQKPKFKVGDYVITKVPETSTLHLPSGGGLIGAIVEHSKKTIKRRGIILGICSVHYDCYQVCDGPDDSLSHCHCMRFDRVTKDKEWKEWPSIYKPGMKILSKSIKSGKNYMSHHRFGTPEDKEIVEYTLHYKMQTEGLWYASVPYSFYYSKNWDLAYRLLKEKEFVTEEPI